MANPARAYLATQVETTTQGELLVMLYEAAIKFLKRAKIEIGNKDFAKKGIYISKAMAIIHELAESLNKEKGGNITPTLLSLYQFCTTQLVQANIRLDTKRIDDVIRILDGIRSAYAQVVTQDEGRSAAATISAKGKLQAQAQAQAAVQAEADAAPAQEADSNEPQPSATAAPKPDGRYGLSGLSGMALRKGAPAAPQAAPMAPPEVPPVAPPPPAAPRAAAPAPAQTAPPAEQPPAAPQPPAPPQLQVQPKLRTAFNAAKFRAANAYSNNS